MVAVIPQHTKQGNACSQATNAEGCRIKITKTIRTMKKFMEIMGNDILSENFTRREYVVYGIVAPLVLVLMCVLAGSLE